MATTVTGTLIDHPDPTAVQVSATLVDLDGHQRTGYVETLSGQIHTAIVTTPDRDGAWTLDLVANSLIESDWGDTLWRISEGDSSDYGQTASTYITVPASGGPYWVGAIRTDPPGGASPQYRGVTSVNGETGAVTLDAADLSALPLTGGTLNGSLALSGASSNLTVGGSTTITGLLTVDDNATVTNSLEVANSLTVGGDATITGNADMQGDVSITTAGKGLAVAEGSNARMGIATLVAGIADVSTTAVTADSRIFLTNQSPSGTVGAPRVQTRTPGSSFRIQSSQLTDTSVIAWLIVEPA